MEKEVIYGPRAKENFKAGSDIDITIEGNDIHSSDLNAIILQPDELYLPYTLDLSIYNQIDNQSLLSHVNRMGAILFKR